ncbi:zinc transporter ZIP3-like [Tubulanus polymorphus]|uniref:zinc transporter ZIP3-like n=1 Tax=Tubulanus polymorphus TaxID=672921 RepID=UPI003DA41686
MDLVLLKVIFLISIYVICVFCCCLPLKIIPKNRAEYVDKRSKKILSYCNCFAGGVFLGVCFIGLIPALTHKFTEVLETNAIDVHYPVSELTVVFGFFVIVFVEQLIMACQEKRANHRGEFAVVEMNSLPVKDNDANGGTAETSYTDMPPSDEDLAVFSQEEHPLANKSAPERDNNHGHCHDVAGIGVDSESSVRSYILLLALSVHSVFEGMALGLQEDAAKTINLFIAVVIHESLVFFAMGVSIAKINVSLKAAVQLSLVLSLMIPAGVGLGIGVGNVEGFAGGLSSAILQAIAAGTFIYVIFLEVLPNEIGHHNRDIIKLVLVFVGFLLIAGLQYIHV